MIGIIDYGCGNVGSVQNMLSKLGIWSEIISSSNEISKMKALILPGVGSYDAAVLKLKESGFWNEIINHVELKKKPILGICLGMQLFFEGSEEGKEKGFSWLEGKINKFNKIGDLKIPHIGWEKLKLSNSKEIFSNKDNQYYFVHSYHAPLNLNPKYILGYCYHGVNFPAAIQIDNIIGFQFHPEKSLKYGMQLFSNWYKFIN